MGYSTLPIGRYVRMYPTSEVLNGYSTLLIGGDSDAKDKV